MTSQQPIRSMFLLAVTAALALAAGGALAENPKKQPSDQVCNEQSGLVLCVGRGSVAPLGNKYVAAVSMTFSRANAGVDAYKVLVPLGKVADLDVGGVSGWKLTDFSPLKRCTNVHDLTCAQRDSTFTRITPGTKLMFQLTKPINDAPGQLLADAKTGSFTIALLIASEGSPVKREIFSVSDFPMLVTLAGPR